MTVLAGAGPLPVEKLQALGFRFGTNGVHAARTMMVQDLAQLLAAIPVGSGPECFYEAVVGHNLLGKPTRKARELAARHLLDLYALNEANPIFKALRRLWDANPVAQPGLALLVALARDPLLRLSVAHIQGQVLGANVDRSGLEAVLSQACPDRFSASSLRSFAQNINGTWTAAGFLSGRSRKTRVQPAFSPEVATMAVFLAYLEGRSGMRLVSADWVRLFDPADAEVDQALTAAAHRGLLVYMNAGGVKELRFPGYLNTEQQHIRDEVSHVI